jgi:hypothetical protein
MTERAKRNPHEVTALAATSLREAAVEALGVALGVASEGSSLRLPAADDNRHPEQTLLLRLPADWWRRVQLSPVSTNYPAWLLGFMLAQSRDVASHVA